MNVWPDTTEAVPQARYSPSGRAVDGEAPRRSHARPVHLTFLKVVILVINIIVGGLGALGAYSVLYALEFDLPTRDDIKRRVAGDTLFISSNATVWNNGTFDVDDVSISVFAELDNGTKLLDFHKDVGTVRNGKQKIAIDIPLKMADLLNLTWLIWTPFNLSYSVAVKAQYLYRLVDFEATHFYTSPWPALVKYLRVDWANVEYEYPSEGLIKVRIPYEAGIDPMLSGLVLDTGIAIFNDLGDLIGTAQSAIVLKPTMNEFLEITFDRRYTTDLMTRSQKLRVEITGFFAGQKGTLIDYADWWAPMVGLTVVPNRGPTWVFADYRFVNEAEPDLDLKVTFTALDASGNTIASNTQFKLVPGCPTHTGCPMQTGSIGVNDPAMANAVLVKITFEDQARGFVYRVDIPLSFRGGW